MRCVKSNNGQNKMQNKRPKEERKGGKTERRELSIYASTSTCTSRTMITLPRIQRAVSPLNLTKHVLHKLLGFHATIITNSSRLQKLCGHQTTKTKRSRISYTVRIRKKPTVRGVWLVKSLWTRSPTGAI